MRNESNKSLWDGLRGARDSAMEDMAKVTLAWTSSDAFHTINAAKEE